MILHGRITPVQSLGCARVESEAGVLSAGRNGTGNAPAGLTAVAGSAPSADARASRTVLAREPVA